MKLTKNMKLVFQGDSITDAGRAQPIAEGLFDPMGRGYVHFCDAALNARYPELNLHVVNVGISGNNSRDLVARWQRDVLDLKPDWVTCMIGTNDIWRQFDTPWQKEWHVYPEEYRANLQTLVQQTLPHVKGMVLLTPFYIEPNKNDPMRAQMDRYSAIVKEVAAAHRTLFVDTQGAIDKVLQHYYPATLSWDRVHPSSIGHMVIAKSLLKVLEFAWD